MNALLWFLLVLGVWGACGRGGNELPGEGGSPQPVFKNFRDFTGEVVSTEDASSTSPSSTDDTYSDVNDIENSLNPQSSTVYSTFTSSDGYIVPLDEELNTTEEIPAAAATTCPEIDETVPSNFTVEADNFYAILSWDPPENSNCDLEYLVYLDDEEKTITSDTTYTIEDLYACVEYVVGLAAYDGTSIGPVINVTVNTTVPLPFNYSVQSLQAEKASGDVLNITWSEPPDEVVHCVTSYSLMWWQDEETTVVGDNIPAPTTYYETSIVGCMKYVIQIIPQVGDSAQGLLLMTNYTADPRPSSAPDIKGFSFNSRQANVTWGTENKTINRCPVEEIIVTCNAPEDLNSNFSWIEWNVEKVEPIKEQSVSYRYPMTIDGLSPFTNYTCNGTVINEAGPSPAHNFEFKTDEEVPPAPGSIQVTDVGPRQFTLVWTEPEEVPGILTEYHLLIDTSKSECVNNTPNFSFTLGAENTTYVFDEAIPYYEYQVSVYAVDGAGRGDSTTTNVTTQSAEPDPVTNAERESPIYSQAETYGATVEVRFDPPCYTNGPFKRYEISYNGTRDNFDVHRHTIVVINETSVNIDLLLPERSYTFDIIVVTENYTSVPVSLPPLVTKSGVPVLVTNMTPPTAIDTDKAYFTLRRSAFDNINGEIVAWALILLTSEENSEGFGFWNGSNETWPSVPNNSYQLTPNFWNPFTNPETDTVDFIIGTGENKALNDNTKYWLMVRALTTAAYKDSQLLHFQTEMLDDLDLALILGLTFGLLALLVLVIFLVFLWRRKRKTKVLEEVEKRPSTTTLTPVPVQKYAVYYASIKENYNIIKQQYTDLGTQSKEAALPITYATLPENRRKNRYTNILPFDETRVKLKIDEDDEISSDYINASYVKGYSGKVEYIATQGPLESTTRDFWKMILQENVSIIVMVSQFVEQSKEKCHQYFPNNHESISFGESLEVKCSTELHFGTYCIRTLQVRKGTEQRHVIHMQFLEWPDFGVPQGTDNMLLFCGQLREKANSEGGLIVVHCSAGVGRTGTLIALDILLQTIDDHRDINIYKTVLDLRRQRINMVQTEKQYMFIHTCIKEHIDAPPIQSNDSGGERIYENMDVIKSSLKKNLIESEIESAL